MELIENILHSKFSTTKVPTKQDVTLINGPKTHVNGTSVSYKVLVNGSENRLENETGSLLCPTESAAHFHLEQTRISDFCQSRTDSEPAEIKSSRDLEDNPSNLFSKLYAFPNCVNSMGIETRCLEDASIDSNVGPLGSTLGGMPEDHLGSIPGGVPEDHLGSIPGGVPEDPMGSTLGGMPEDHLGSIPGGVPEDHLGSIPGGVPEDPMGSTLGGMPEDHLGSIPGGVPEDHLGSIPVGVPEDPMGSTLGGMPEDHLESIPGGVPEDSPGGTPTKPLDRPVSLPMDTSGNGGMNWDETAKFMHAYIEQIFSPGTDVSSDDKSRFGKLCQEMDSTGRLWFSRFLCEQRCNSKRVSEQTFFRLVQSIAVVLFECHNLDDFGPAKNLMTMCFTYYYMSCATTEPSFFKKSATKGQNKMPARWRDVFDFRELRQLMLGDDKSSLKAESKHDGDDRNGTAVNAEGQREKAYLYSHLKQQPIWHTSRFWDAAFLDAVHSERNKQSPTTHQKWYLMTPEERDDENRTNENLTFGQLSTFIFNMLCLGLGRSECQTFLDKHSIIGNLSKVQKETLQEQMEDLIVELGQ
uniref:uncharacterized protein KIAA0513 homolog isoform X2 n=2 Tax=Myxine glutinosa TaxID=7769 RepID=UPI00358FD0C4